MRPPTASSFAFPKYHEDDSGLSSHGFSVAPHLVVECMYNDSKNLAEHVVLDLMKKYLNEGRTLITDNFYTSVPSKKEVVLLPIKHKIEMLPTDKTAMKEDKLVKPLGIVDYNKGKQDVDISDQLESYFFLLRKTIRWYHKVIVILLLNTAVVNASLIGKKFSEKPVTMKTFREKIIIELLGLNDTRPSNITPKLFLQ
ncbi:hypothetical protein ILUMI_22957 [Ignelater luminosus]|uniref:PiggyBac transposable element-derived protein domain-containing protein n=1 Tax=Ignelater luminosus TaxID=2038154 RepID=A0A8K0FX57_IGNLU|nr:hypothetical protein ILUMI_22957 [Ignelater luminosus]